MPRDWSPPFFGRCSSGPITCTQKGRAAAWRETGANVMASAAYLDFHDGVNIVSFLLLWRCFLASAQSGILTTHWKGVE